MKKLFLSLTLILTACTTTGGTTPPTLSTTDLDLTLLDEVYTHITSDYLDPSSLDKSTLEYGLARGLVNSLPDPYSEFLDPTETETLYEDLAGNLIGIGAELSSQEGEISVVSPLRGSPAEEAGLRPGDIILAVDETLTYDLSLFEAVQQIRGETGTSVTLNIWRPSTEENLDITITRAEIHVPSAELSWVGESSDIPLITINSFNESTAIEFFTILDQIIYLDTPGYIIDLRYNGGGFLEDAVDIASYFLHPDDLVVEVRGRTEADTESFHAFDLYNDTETPLVILINEGSASASEILAGALQDHSRATLIGTQSYGKGTVQELLTLSDGSSLRLTIGKWYTPAGTSIDDSGITPDEVIEYTEADYANETDPQLDRAIQLLSAS